MPALAPALAGAAAPADSAHDIVVVTGTRVTGSGQTLPLSVSRVDSRLIREGQPLVNLSEALVAVPGVSAQNRQNYAQDLQLSVRGFGARSSFGVRGVRLYADGIPGTMPDGQGQFSHFDLGSAGRIEVLRGPYSALYGNSAGGVIALFTEDAPPAAQIDAAVESGSFGLRRYALKGAGQLGQLGVVLDAVHFGTNGYRDHSAAERNTVNGKVRGQLDARSALTLTVNAVDIPEAQDPLGLNRAQLATDPRQAGTNALAYDTRKSVRQEQAGASYERAVGGGGELGALVYGGHRSTRQFQAILRAVELATATHPGGVIDLERNFRGTDLHFTQRRALARQALRLTLGVSYDHLDEARKGFLNFAGDQLGVAGELRREESNRVYDLDEYLQLQWERGASWRALLGARHSTVAVRSRDHLAALAGAADSSVRFRAFNPVAGLSFRAAPGVNVYSAYGKGFETPTLNDLAYRSTDGSVPGLNLGLRPARSDNYELGVKTTGARLRTALAAFFIDTRDELAVKSSSGGRTVFENIEATRRRGAELELEATLPRGFTGRLAYTHLQAETAAGLRLPAVSADSVYGALRWSDRPDHFSVTLEALGRARIYVDDRNTDSAAGYGLLNLHCELRQQRGTLGFTESLRVDNLGDRGYVGSVIVNESNSRYFEPEPGRTAYLSIAVTHRR